MSIRYIRQSDMARCPFAIIDPTHYRNDGTCKCDDESERDKMITDWGYTEEDFKNIPLRVYIPAPALSVLDTAITQVTAFSVTTIDIDRYDLQEAIDNLRLVWAQIGGSDVSS